MCVVSSCNNRRSESKRFSPVNQDVIHWNDCLTSLNLREQPVVSRLSSHFFFFFFNYMNLPHCLICTPLSFPLSYDSVTSVSFSFFPTACQRIVHSDAGADDEGCGQMFRNPYLLLHLFSRTKRRRRRLYDRTTRARVTWCQFTQFWRFWLVSEILPSFLRSFLLSSLFFVVWSFWSVRRGKAASPLPPLVSLRRKFRCRKEGGGEAEREEERERESAEGDAKWLGLETLTQKPWKETDSCWKYLWKSRSSKLDRRKWAKESEWVCEREKRRRASREKREWHAKDQREKGDERRSKRKTKFFACKERERNGLLSFIWCRGNACRWILSCSQESAASDPIPCSLVFSPWFFPSFAWAAIQMKSSQWRSVEREKRGWGQKRVKEKCAVVQWERERELLERMCESFRWQRSARENASLEEKHEREEEENCSPATGFER